MGIQILGQVGESILTSGSPGAPFRQGNQGDMIVSELHGRFYEGNRVNRLFSGGMSLTAINNATFTTGTLTAACTPIAGVWNPLTSPANLVVLQCSLGLTMTALQATGPGPFVWAVSNTNFAITTGAVPLNRKSLQAGASVAKNMAGVALTGLTVNLTVVGASSLSGGSATNAAFLATAAGIQTQLVASCENIDGAFIVPPGGVLALLATTTPVAHSAVSMLIWEEVPLAQQ